MFIKSTKTKYLPSFVRRNRLVTQAKKDAISNVLPRFLISPNAINDFIALHKNSQISLEIGFGNGEHLLKKALLYPDEVFIGCEPYLKGVAQLLGKIQSHNINNIRIYAGDARDILEQMQGNSLNNIYVLFPDPWPKNKQHKRRIINHETLALFAAKLRKNGRLLCATDHRGYAEWILKHLCSQQLLILQPTSKELDCFLIPPTDWCGTKYEQKANHASYYFVSIFQQFV